MFYLLLTPLFLYKNVWYKFHIAHKAIITHRIILDQKLDINIKIKNYEQN